MNIQSYNIIRGVFFGFVILFALILLFCNGWNAGTGNGRCLIPATEPLYNFAMGLALIASFTAIIWLPAIILMAVIGILKNKRLAKKGPAQ